MKITAEIRLRKRDRIRKGASPRVLELCSGCGGLSLGFAAAGFGLYAHVENDNSAAATYALNFSAPKDARTEEWLKPRDMIECDAETLVQNLGFKTPVAETFDVLAAGLPCQAFARIGRSKLRSLAGDEEAFRNDPRARLYKRFLDYVVTTQPAAIVIENVPDILNFGGHNLPEEICETLTELGYETGYTLLNAAFFGVPQMRERLFLIALDHSIERKPGFPLPSHATELPAGYEGARNVALKYVCPRASRYDPISNPSANLPKAVSAGMALRDLPYISEHFRDAGAMRRRKVSEELPYRVSEGVSEYAQLMRSWAGFETAGKVTGNVVRLTPRDFPIFRSMRPGADYPEALRVAEDLFRKKLNELPSPPKEGSSEWEILRRQSVPPYDPYKFPNKWWKLDPEFPSRTLTAHIGKDTYSHIHWDSRQQRTISVREAARLQSFPDGFRFAGAMNASFRQIGNAVPPLLAYAIALRLKRDLQNATEESADETRLVA